jgi:lipopolysaccharide biosynthesis regulator YciM
MTAGEFWLLVIILALIVAFVGLPWLAGRRRERETWDPSGAYLQTIDALLRGRKLEAMEALRRVARRETDNLLAYLRLGDLVRAMGFPDKAERIHTGLLARPAEDPDLTLKVRESLLEDAVAQGHWEDVVRQGEKLRALERKNRVALASLTSAYEARGEWEKAFECLDECSRLDGSGELPRPAQMRIHVAKLHLEQDRTKEARRLLEEAVKADGEEQGRILLGDVLAREGEHEKAIELWLEYARRNPEKAGPVFERLERSYFELGRFGDLLQVYERLSQGSPPPAPATIALADMHRRRGRTEEAIHLLESVLSSNPKNRSARRLLVSCLVQNKRTESALRELDLLIRDLPANSGGTTCPHCHYEGVDLEPKCPRCGAWQPPAPAAPAAGLS